MTSFGALCVLLMLHIIINLTVQKKPCRVFKDSLQVVVLPAKNREEAFTPIWNTLYQYFWPAIFEGTRTNSDHEKQLFSIPARLGGMGVRDPIESAKIAYPHPEQAQESLWMPSKERWSSLYLITMF